MRVWLSDENAIVREKLRTGSAGHLTPLFAEIIGQGVAEGSFAVGSPGDAARVFVSLILGANESATQLALAHEAGTISFEELMRALRAVRRGVRADPGGPARIPDLRRRRRPARMVRLSTVSKERP